MDVLIVGAGFAGIIAGYHLNFLDPNINLQILEARSNVGGRVQNVEAYEGDFNLDLGAQDIFFADKDQLSGLFAEGDRQQRNNFLNEAFRTIPRPVQRADGSLSYRLCDSGSNPDCDDNPSSFYRRESDLADSSYENESLASYLRTYFLPSVEDDIKLNTPVTKIELTDNNKVVATDINGDTYMADQLIVAVPVSQLAAGASNAIEFVPPLPQRYRNSIEDTAADVDNGARIFVEFSTKFYEDVTRVGETVYWDAARFKTNDRNIITIQGNRCRDPNGDTCGRRNDPNRPRSRRGILRRLLRDLDRAYGNRVASRSFEENGEVFFFQNWSNEEYIEMVNRGDVFDEGVYRNPVGGRIWFAGDYTRPRNGNQSGESAKDAAERVFQTLN